MWGGVFIVAILWASLSAKRALARVLLPVVLALALDTLFLSLLGERLSLFHVIALLLVLGIGLDYSLFFSRPDPDVRVRARTAHAVTVCMISTVAVFGILGGSQIPVLRAIGVTVAIGVVLSFLLSIILSRLSDARSV